MAKLQIVLEIPLENNALDNYRVDSMEELVGVLKNDLKLGYYDDNNGKLIYSYLDKNALSNFEDTDIEVKSIKAIDK